MTKKIIAVTLAVLSLVSLLIIGIGCDEKKLHVESFYANDDDGWCINVVLHDESIKDGTKIKITVTNGCNCTKEFTFIKGQYESFIFKNLKPKWSYTVSASGGLDYVYPEKITIPNEKPWYA